MLMAQTVARLLHFRLKITPIILTRMVRGIGCRALLHRSTHAAVSAAVALGARSLVVGVMVNAVANWNHFHCLILGHQLCQRLDGTYTSPPPLRRVAWLDQPLRLLEPEPVALFRLASPPTAGEPEPVALFCFDPPTAGFFLPGEPEPVALFRFDPPTVGVLYYIYDVNILCLCCINILYIRRGCWRSKNL